MCNKNVAPKNGICLTVPRVERQYTAEQLEYLKELSARGLFNREITEKFNKKFCTNKTENAIHNQRSNHGLKTSARNYWQKGNAPWNKGRKGVVYPGMVATQFKKGSIPPNRAPIGMERTTRDGYAEIKTRDGKLNDNWAYKHRLIWEKHHGKKIPKNHVVIFGDGNRQNFDPDNLLLVSRAQLAMLNKHKLIQGHADLTRAGVIIADIYRKAAERKKEG